MFKGKKSLTQWLRKVFNPRVPFLLYLAGALLLPLVFGGLHFLLYRALGGTVDFSAASPWYTYPAYLIPTALLTGGNEEPGWRGFALPGLLQWFHPIITALILGLIHAAWHLPLLNHYQTTFGIYAFNVIGLTFLLNWFYMKSKGSIFPVMLLHAATNVVGEFIPMPMELLGGTAIFMVLRGTVYWAIAVTLIVITKGRLGCEKQIQLSGPDRKQKPIRKTAS
jgi:membrane protease YdiL (CAAX protease family)